jgi:hypothetical protein
VTLATAASGAKRAGSDVKHGPTKKKPTRNHRVGPSCQPRDRPDTGRLRVFRRGF